MNEEAHSGVGARRRHSHFVAADLLEEGIAKLTLYLLVFCEFEKVKNNCTNPGIFLNIRKPFLIGFVR
jgi:hypothetical protein